MKMDDGITFEEKKEDAKRIVQINDEYRPNDFCINFIQNLCHLSLLKLIGGVR